MSVISDNIEVFIKEMIAELDGSVYELKRNELAEQFGCAPSQINYVLRTRFTPQRGYAIESRRGGGGCIKVYKVDVDKHEIASALIKSYINKDSLDEKSVKLLLNDLLNLGVINKKQGIMMLSALSDRALPIAEPLRGVVRASVLRSMIAALFADNV